MKAGVYLVLMGVIVSFLIANAYGKTISLDPTDTTTGNDSKVIKIGEMKYNYEVKIYVKNTHDISPISVALGLYYISSEVIELTPLDSYEWKLISGNELNWYDRDREFFWLKPQEEGSFSLMKIRSGKTDNLGMMITAGYNTSAYNDQQTDVSVYYTIKVYDDRGELIIDSEDPNKRGDTGEVVEDTSCCGQIIILGIGALLITSLLLKRMNRGKLK